MASTDVVDFTNHMEKANLSVYQLMQDKASALVQSNRLKMQSILKAIVFFCGKQMILLRGHQEQAGAHINPGNFYALLDFRVDAGDMVLAKQQHKMDNITPHKYRMTSFHAQGNGLESKSYKKCKTPSFSQSVQMRQLTVQSRNSYL